MFEFADVAPPSAFDIFESSPLPPDLTVAPTGTRAAGFVLRCLIRTWRNTCAISVRSRVLVPVSRFRLGYPQANKECFAKVSCNATADASTKNRAHATHAAKNILGQVPFTGPSSNDEGCIVNMGSKRTCVCLSVRSSAVDLLMLLDE
jgi:hypothetical protein